MISFSHRQAHLFHFAWADKHSDISGRKLKTSQWVSRKYENLNDTWTWDVTGSLKIQIYSRVKLFLFIIEWKVNMRQLPKMEFLSFFYSIFYFSSFLLPVYAIQLLQTLHLRFIHLLFLFNFIKLSNWIFFFSKTGNKFPSSFPP